MSVTTQRSAAGSLAVVFALHDGDGKYWRYTAVAISSVLQHASAPVRLFVIHDATVPAPTRQRLQEIAGSWQTDITFVEAQLPAGVEPSLFRQFSPASIFRLMVPSILPTEEAVVYLDSDLVLNQVDVHDVVRSSRDDAPLSAVLDPFIGRVQRYVEALRQLGLDPDAYFNSGVLVMRPPLIGADLLLEFSRFSAAHTTLIHPDQDFLNVRFQSERQLLPERLNTLIGYSDRRMLMELGWYTGRILHYTGGGKPLQGELCPAFIPFFAHSLKVPEVYDGRDYNPQRYLFPVKGAPNKLLSRLIWGQPA